MATIYWRGDAAYLNWSEGGKQHRRSLGTVSPHEADTARRTKELELRTGKRIFTASARFTDHLAKYLTWHRAQYPDSHFRVQQITEQHLAEFASQGLSQITSSDIEVWKARRMSQPISPETVAKELRTLKAILQKAVEWGEIDRNPAEYVDAPRSLNSEPIHWYSKPQLARLYTMHHGADWRLMANTGMRRTEALQLRWPQVDLRRRTLQIISSAEARTKSGRWREVPLSASAITALKVLRKRQGLTDHVLPRITAESLSRAFLQDVARLGLSGSLHSLRHTYGAHLVMAGVPLRTVQVLMGHASFATTERYAHVGKDHLRDQARLVNL